MPKIPEGAVYKPVQNVSEGATYNAPATGAKPEAPGFLRKAWDGANTGIVSGQSMTRAATGHTQEELRDAAYGNKTEAQYQDEAAHPISSFLRNFTLGATADAGDVASSFTSPASIATMGLGGAAGAGVKAAGTAAKAIGVGYGLKGAYDAANSPVSASDLIKKTGYALGGPDSLVENSTSKPEDIANLYGSGAMVAGGAAAGASLPGKRVGNFLQNKAYGTMNNLLGVYGRDMKYGINPGRGVVQEGIAGANKASILNKIDARIPELKTELNNTAASPAMQGRTVDLYRSVNEPFDMALAAGDQQSTGYLNRLLQTQKELNQQRVVNGSNRVEFTNQPQQLNGLSVPDALNVKEGIGRRTNFATDSTGQNVNPVLKEAYGRTNRDIRTVAPEIAPTLDRLADLQQGGSSLHESIGRRLANPSSGISQVAPAVIGTALGGTEAGLGMMAAEKTLSSVPVKSYGAQLAYKVGKNLQKSKAGVPYGSIAAAVAGRKR